jgi:hypothetical protein
MIEKHRQDRRPIGVSRDDIARFNQALHGLRYPVEKWQLIAHAVQSTDGPEAVELRTIEQLWALPAGRYRNFDQVLDGAARTARGHPRRGDGA